MRNVVYVPCNASKTTFTILYNPHALLSLNFCLFLVFCYSAIAFSLFRVLYLRISLIHNQKQKKKNQPVWWGLGWLCINNNIFFFTLMLFSHILFSNGFPFTSHVVGYTETRENYNRHFQRLIPLFHFSPLSTEHHIFYELNHFQEVIDTKFCFISGFSEWNFQWFLV